MGSRTTRKKKESSKRRWGEGNGFEGAGGYMNAKKNKLLQQFHDDKEINESDSKSSIFKGVSIFVNGYTDPPSDELRRIMMEHGGSFHHYLIPRKTTHIIATNLPETKIKNLKGDEVIVNPSWITDSVKTGSLLDYKPYLLYTNSNKNQPQIKFDKISRVTKDANDENFIGEFYGNSRLHHISSMACNFKTLVSEMRDAKLDDLYPAREKLKSLKHRSSTEPVIMHIDMDCFFVSVGLLCNPVLKGEPVGVTHSKNGEGPSSSTTVNNSMSEIASCSYEARAAGVKNGMFVGDAMKLCPNIKFIPYDFDAYVKVATKLYEIVANYTLNIQAVSCDEMLVDLKDIQADSIEFAEVLRKEVFEFTGCHASVGIGGNILLAKLATRNAKPNGVFRISSDEREIAEFMKSVSLSDLSGVGRKMVFRLKENFNVSLCGEVRAKLTLQDLQKEFGTKTGKNIYNGVRGVTDVTISYGHERKSVSAEVNYGIRFQEEAEAYDFLERLSKEVSIRCRNLNILGGRSITLKLMIRADGASKETSKYMGHGICDNKSRTSTLSMATREKSVILREVKCLLKKMDVVVSDIRGVGIQIGKLDKKNSDSLAGSTSVLMSFINKVNPLDTSSSSKELSINQQSPSKNCNPSYPNSKELSNDLSLSMSQIDQNVFKSLPEDIKMEIELQMKIKKSNKCNNKELPKSRITKMNDTSRLSYSQLDQDVLAQLPQELLEEVKNTYGSGPSTRNSSKTADNAFKVLMSPSKSKSPLKKKSPVKRRGRKPTVVSPKKQLLEEKFSVDLMKKEDSCNVEVVRQNGRLEFSSPPPPSDADLNGVRDLEGIRELIFEWIRSSDSPTQDDIETVSSFFFIKLSESEYDFVRSLLLQLRRLTSIKDEDSPWRSFYLNLYEKVQSIMINKEGLKLYV
ncbi:DNA repair protein Rev1 [Lepeophtheirus salmonis]|uniref:DNA repair protein Rev1 n=1 Tax=Lepeophtheirus salmonis TaxID=72036 RepID=UPI001AE12E4A|nr:DNA repair protein REV1-like [Lepeophtheirus salmonis]